MLVGIVVEAELEAAELHDQLQIFLGLQIGRFLRRGLRIVLSSYCKLFIDNTQLFCNSVFDHAISIDFGDFTSICL